MTLGPSGQKRTAGAVDLRTNTVVHYCGALLVTLPVALLIEEGRIRTHHGGGDRPRLGRARLSIGAISLLLVLISPRGGGGGRLAAVPGPACSAVMAWALFGETLAPLQMLGMAVAAAGVAVASALRRRPDRTAHQ